MCLPYTYLIGWTKQNKFYYGVRYAVNCNPNDLWVSYFTSSKYVAKFRKQHGEPDIIQVRHTFCNVESARQWEHKVLRRMKVKCSSKWLNMNDVESIVPFYMLPIEIQNSIIEKKRSYRATEETKQKQREAAKRKVIDPEKERIRKEKIGKGNTGKVRSQEFKDDVSKRNSGKRFSDEVNKSKGRPGISRPEHSEAMKQAYLNGRLPQLSVSRPHTDQTKDKMRKPKSNKDNYQNRKWWRSMSLQEEKCVPSPPDWPDVERGRLPRSLSKSD